MSYKIIKGDRAKKVYSHIEENGHQIAESDIDRSIKSLSEALEKQKKRKAAIAPLSKEVLEFNRLIDLDTENENKEFEAEAAKAAEKLAKAAKKAAFEAEEAKKKAK